ncbi:Ubx domain-containing protein [Coemansia sp. RSA 552]|nr:Ubx domain-containing protein [Coemansia sp. RSA 552]
MPEPSVDSILDELSDSERQCLQTFCEVTKVNDLEDAARVLRSRQWNIEQAVQLYYEPGNAVSQPAAGSSSDHSNGSDDDDGLCTEEQPAANDTQLPGPAVASSGLRQRRTAANTEGRGADPTPERKVPEIRRPQFRIFPLLAWPFVLVLEVCLAMVRMLLGVVGLGRIAPAGIPGQSPPALSENSNTDVAHFEQLFEERFGPVHPPFFGGPLAAAQTAARRHLKYLVVVLCSREHDDMEMLGQVLAHPDTVEYLSQSQFIVWAGDLSEGEAYDAGWALGATAYPSIAVVAVGAQRSAGQQGSRLRLRLIAQTDGLPGAARGRVDDVGSRARALVGFLRRPVEAHDQIISSVRREQQGREAERRLREQQNADYEASLARDREREEEARVREEQERVEREETETRRREQEQLDQQRARWRWAALARILQAEAKELPTPDQAATAGDSGKLSLRLEDGSRVIKTFTAASTVRDVFEFIETRGVAETWERTQTTPFGDDIHAVQMPEDYEHSYDFALVSQFPRVVLDDMDARLKDALSAKGLWPSAVLIAEPLFESESEGSDDNEEGDRPAADTA